MYLLNLSNRAISKFLSDIFPRRFGLSDHCHMLSHK